MNVTITRLNENKPLLTTESDTVSGAIHAAMRAYSESSAEHHTSELIERLGERAWRLQPGRQIERGSVSLDRPIIVEVFESA